jgi:hypothetical protein
MKPQLTVMKLTEHKAMHIKHIWDEFVNKNYFKRSW